MPADAHARRAGAATGSCFHASFEAAPGVTVHVCVALSGPLPETVIVSLAPALVRLKVKLPTTLPACRFNGSVPAQLAADEKTEPELPSVTVYGALGVTWLP
jgi:hypothetical protein